MTDRPGLPDYLRDDYLHDGPPRESSPPKAPSPPAEHGTRRVTRRGFALVIAAVAIVSGALGSAVTYALTQTHGGASSAAAVPTTTTTTTIGGEFVQVGQPATLAGWTVVVTRARVESAVPGIRFDPARRWLVVDAQLTNRAPRTRMFTPDMLEAHSLSDTGDGAYVSAASGTVWEPPPNATLQAEFLFPVPAGARVFTMVIRQESETPVQHVDSVEIDLGCCAG